MFALRCEHERFLQDFIVGPKCPRPERLRPNQPDLCHLTHVHEVTDPMSFNCKNDMWTKSLTLADSKLITVRMP